MPVTMNKKDFQITHAHLFKNLSKETNLKKINPLRSSISYATIAINKPEKCLLEIYIPRKLFFQTTIHTLMM